MDSYAKELKQRYGNDLILVCILHLLSDLEVLHGTSSDIYANVGHIISYRSKRILTMNKSVNKELVFTFRRGSSLKEQ
jgi:hypothetical protein